MKRVAGAAMLVSVATPAFAAGGIDEAPLWYHVFIVGLVGLLTAGVGFFLAGFLGLIGTISTVVCIALGFLSLVFLSDPDRASDFVLGALVLLTFFSPTLVGGWWLGRKDTMRRLKRKNTLSAGSNHG